MTKREFWLPDPGEGLVEAEIVTWRVGVGDAVAVNDIVVEVETSKSLVELPSPYAGTVTALLAAEGEMVDVGVPIIAIDDGVGPDLSAPAAGDDSARRGPETDQSAGADAPRSDIAEAGAPVVVSAEPGQPAVVAPVGEDAPTDDMVPPLPDPAPSSPADGEQAGGRVPVLVGYGPRTTEAKRRPRKARTPDPQDAEARAHLAASFSVQAPVSRRSDQRAPLSPAQASPVGGPLPRPSALPDVRGAVPDARGVAGREHVSRPTALAKPPVRKLAKDLGIDLTGLIGSGPDGTITRSDVQAAVEATGPSPAPTATGDGVGLAQEARPEEVRIPVRGVRRATAEAMVASAFTAPHVTEWLTCDVTAAMELLERLRSRREFAEIKVSPLVLVAKAVCLALRQNPDLNATWDDSAGEIVEYGAVNLGIAAATPRGLMVPNLKQADRLELVDLARQIAALTATAREGRTPPADLARGTFTITNVGVFGVDAGTPILNPGEAGILCVGAIDRRPWVVRTGSAERIEPRWVTTLALSFDHRLVDGEAGSRFLADVAGLLSDPGLALLY